MVRCQYLLIQQSVVDSLLYCVALGGKTELNLLYCTVVFLTVHFIPCNMYTLLSQKLH